MDPSAVSGLPTLPKDIFWIIVSQLEPRDLIRCRRVSKLWHQAFVDPTNLGPLLTMLFPYAKETRERLQLQLTRSASGHDALSNFSSKIFDRVACRYYHLARGKPTSVKKYALCGDYSRITGEREWFPVPPWESHASHLNQRVDLLLREASWSYEDGLLVYPSAEHHCLVLMDVSRDEKIMLPFLITGKVIRRVRLHHSVLVVEWAEPKAFHWLNDSDGVHRHFASSFDVRRTGKELSVEFRNEWKIMFLGHPLSERDRFFSSHNKTHYTVYIWQPNRSLYTADEDAPIESLFVWDISKPSSYRPSLDPTGRLKDDGEDDGPYIVARFGFRELGLYSIRQRGIPSIQRLEVAKDGCSVQVTEHMCVSTEDPLVGPIGWASLVNVISIPLVGDGPCRRRLVSDVFPPYRGNGGLQSSPLNLGWRSDLPWYNVISETTDMPAHVCFRMYMSPDTWPTVKIVMGIETPSSDITLEPEKITELSCNGNICGTESFLIGENRNRELVIYWFDNERTV